MGWGENPKARGRQDSSAWSSRRAAATPTLPGDHFEITLLQQKSQRRLGWKRPLRSPSPTAMGGFYHSSGTQKRWEWAERCGSPRQVRRLSLLAVRLLTLEYGKANGRNSSSVTPYTKWGSDLNLICALPIEVKPNAV